MTRTNKLPLAAAGMLTCLSLAAFAPAANADEGFYERNGADRAAAGIPNGNQFVPTPTPTAEGFDASDAALGALAGLVAAGAGVIAVGGLRRRQAHLAHPA
jgi:hypothetical protein